MNKIVKKHTNKILIAIIIIMLCTFVMPVISFGALVEGYVENNGITDGGELRKFAVPLFLLIPDLLLEKLQQIFIDETSSIGLSDPKGGISHYFIYYSPGKIFSGMVPGLDVNFFSPMGNEKGEVTLTRTEYEYTEITRDGDYTINILQDEYGLKTESTKQGSNYSDTLTAVFWFGKEVRHITWVDDKGTETFDDDVQYWYHVSSKSDMPYILYVVGGVLLCIAGVALAWHSGGTSLALAKWGVGMIVGTMAADWVLGELTQAFTGGSLYIVTTLTKTSTRISIAYTLRSIVATYYRVLFEIALVVLLSVLVYVAIKMVLSASSKEKAKYKQMMGHWVTAICILFLLHFFMNMVLTSVQSINDVFSSVFIDTDGKDLLMSDIRTRIGHDPENEDLTQVFSSIVIYITLVIYTIQYTLVYLKRVIHIAFLIMISPMVVFTYPIDKMKDGKSQALNLWLKEFSFNSLMQPIHLILYYIFVEGAINYVMINPIYAVVMIGFLKPGEKFVRKIFGLEEDSSLGKMATAAFGGAAIMSGIKSLGSKIPKGPKGNGGTGKDTKIRTKNPDKDPYEALKGKETSRSGSEGGKSPEAAKRDIKNGPKKGSGWGNLAKRYVFNKNSAKNILKGGARLAGAATLGTVGLAAGLATGDPEKALVGAAGGIAAGNRLGGNLVDKGSNLINGVSGGISGIRDTYGEGVYGEQEYARMKFDREFKKSEEYKNLMDKYPGKENDVQEILNAGITDTTQMEIAMENIKKGNYSVEEAVGFMKMAKASDCPDEILYDEEMFKTYLSARGIPETEAKRIQKAIVEFK